MRRLPEGPAWQYEPKWDGFRCIAFRRGDDVQLQSKACRPLGRYFPDVAAAIAALPGGDVVLDGELVVPVDGAPSFDELQLRLHPAASRVARLAGAHPATLVAFDLLAEGATALVDRPLAERRAALERLAARRFRGATALALSPTTTAVAEARRWLDAARGGLDGVVAKRRDLPYQSGNRTGMVKVKRVRTIDCVVGGFRRGRKSPLVGSLLLGLYDDDGRLHHVGFTSGIPAAERPALTRRLESLMRPPGFTGAAPGGPSRWSTERSGDWTPLAPTLVVEVQSDHFTGRRMRHGARLVRWRPDKAPRQCTFAQLATAGRSSLTLLRRTG